LGGELTWPKRGEGGENLILNGGPHLKGGEKHISKKGPYGNPPKGNFPKFPKRGKRGCPKKKRGPP